MEKLKVAVVGAGMMGSEIALVFALGGYDVRITDQSIERAKTAITALKGVVDKGISRGFFSETAGASALSLISTASLEDLVDRDLVIEAIYEDVAAKKEIYRRLDPLLAPHAMIASNTSSISITALSGALTGERRSRFLGTHFFSPASRMKLVEVISGLDTDPSVRERVRGILADVGKETVAVKDVVGFAVNRALHAFFIEAIRLVEEGAISVEDMDKACKFGLGHPIGPFELMDATKNDLALQVQDILLENYGERFRPPSLLRTLTSAGYNGRAAGRGWYQYRNGKRVIELQ